MATSDSTPKKPAAKTPAAKKPAAKKSAPASATPSTASTPQSTASTPGSASSAMTPASPAPGQGAPPAGGPQQPALQPMLETDARTFAMLSHLSPILLSWTGLGWAGTLVFYLMYKDRSLLVREHAREELNLQLTLLIVATGAVLLSFLTFGIGFVVFVPALVIFGVIALVMQIIAAVTAYNGEYYRYGIAFSILR